MQAENVPKDCDVQVSTFNGTQSTLEFLNYCRQIGDSDVLSSDLTQSITRRNEDHLIETRKQLDTFRHFHIKQGGMATSSSESLELPILEPKGMRSEIASRLAFLSKFQPGMKIVREEMAKVHSRLQYLEDEVKLIPTLKIKISVLQQEKQNLRSELALCKAECKNGTTKHNYLSERNREDEGRIASEGTHPSDTRESANEGVVVEKRLNDGTGKFSIPDNKAEMTSCCNSSCTMERSARSFPVDASTNTPVVEMKDSAVTVIPDLASEYRAQPEKEVMDRSVSTEDDGLLNRCLDRIADAPVSGAAVESKEESLKNSSVQTENADTAEHSVTHSVGSGDGGVSYANASVGDFELQFGTDHSTSMLSSVELKECSVGTDTVLCEYTHVCIGDSNPQCLPEFTQAKNLQADREIQTPEDLNASKCQCEDHPCSTLSDSCIPYQQLEFDNSKDCQNYSPSTSTRTLNQMSCIHEACNNSLKLPNNLTGNKEVQVQPSTAEISTSARILVETSEACVATDAVEIRHAEAQCPDGPICDQQSYPNMHRNMSDLHQDAIGLGALTSEIGEYVGKVDMLLEEQQSLLADNLKDFISDGARVKESIAQETVTAETSIGYSVEHPTSLVQEISVGILEGRIDGEQPSRKLADHLRSACMTACVHINNSDSASDIEFDRSLTLLKDEWFLIAAHRQSAAKEVEWFVAEILEVSLDLLKILINTADSSGNTALHYAVSLRNFPVLLVLVDIHVLDANLVNNAGYTASMLASIINIKDDFEEQAVGALFSKADVNIHARQAGQTALMLAVCHGCGTTARMLLEQGAEVNAKDEDGSTALMCAIEHRHLAIVKMLLSCPRCEPTITDKDGSTALDIALETNQRNVAILLYARLKLLKSTDICDPDC